MLIRELWEAQGHPVAQVLPNSVLGSELFLRERHNSQSVSLWSWAARRGGGDDLR